MGYEGRAIPWYEGVDAAFSASEERIRGRRDTQKRRITGLARQYGRVGVAGWRLRSARVAWVSAAPAGSSGKVGDVSGVKAAKRCSAVAAGAPEPLTPSSPSFLPSFPPRTRAHTHIHTQSRPYLRETSHSQPSSSLYRHSARDQPVPEGLEGVGRVCAAVTVDRIVCAHAQPNARQLRH